MSNSTEISCSLLELSATYTSNRFIMKYKIVIPTLVLLLAGSAAYYFLMRPPPSPVPQPLSQEQLQGAMQDMLTRKAEKKSLMTQLAVYEKMLIQFPESSDLQGRVDSLKARIRELEK